VSETTEHARRHRADSLGDARLIARLIEEAELGEHFLVSVLGTGPEITDWRCACGETACPIAITRTSAAAVRLGIPT